MATQALQCAYAMPHSIGEWNNTRDLHGMRPVEIGIGRLPCVADQPPLNVSFTTNTTERNNLKMDGAKSGQY